jgi:hypothetical protein
LNGNPQLTSAIALADTPFPDSDTGYANTLYIRGNPELECVPSAWPESDYNGTTIPHGNCPASEPQKTEMIVGIAIAVLVLACGAGFLYKRRSAAGDTPRVQKANNDVEMGTFSPNTQPSIQVKLPIGLDPVGSPEFDPEEGIPANDSARALCAKQWTNRRDLNTSFSSDEEAGHTSRVGYADLQAATNSFGDGHKIGDGGSCVVYKAELFGVPCAVKLLSQDASAWEEKQFAAEIDVLTRVKHQNICQLYACSTNGPNRCLVLELMEVSLEDRVRADPPLSWEQRTYILVGVCRGLVHLHSKSPPLIHRDIKSDNVLISGFTTGSLDGESLVKIADFGTARADDRDASGPLQTSGGPTHALTKAVVGTTPYMVGHIADAFSSTNLFICFLCTAS